MRRAGVVDPGTQVVTLALTTHTGTIHDIDIQYVGFAFFGSPRVFFLGYIPLFHRFTFHCVYRVWRLASWAVFFASVL